jgi:hypothetical protein
MASSINASTSGAGGVITTADNTGILNIQTAGTTALTIDTSQRAAFVAGTAALPAITTTGDTNTGIWFPAADTIAFAEGGAESMRIDSSGRVGIGTSSPSAKLQVSDGTTTLDLNPTGGVVYFGTSTNHPMIFNTNSNNIPNEIPYIKLPNKFIDSWKYKLNSENFKIGINWSTDSKDVILNQFQIDYRKNRSFKLEDIKDFFLLENIEFISLQKKINEKEDKKFLKTVKIFKDIDQQHPFIDTAAIILNCDIIMTCDTSVAHLSGALGKETLLLLPYFNDWRWGINENQSVWYNNILLFRQKKINEWQEPVFELLEYLKKKINKNNK